MSFEVSIGDFRGGDFVEISAFSSGQAWNLDAINFPNTEAKHSFGLGVKIGIIDSGYSPQNGLPIPLDVKAFGYRDGVDQAGHGTHVFGIVSSIARNADYYIVRALGADGFGVFSNVVKGIKYLTGKGVDIIQISIGGTKYEEELLQAVKEAHAAGILVVCSNGNSGKDQKFYPSSFDECVSVGATDSYNDLSSFSTIGSQIDLVAPGEDIVSHWIDGKKRKSSGSSMAAPHVSGVAALIIDHYRLDHGVKPSIADIKTTLYNNAQDLGLVGWDKHTGAGIVRVQFHAEKKDLKADPPRWLNWTLKAAAFLFKLWLKRKNKSV